MKYSLAVLLVCFSVAAHATSGKTLKIVADKEVTHYFEEVDTPADILAAIEAADDLPPLPAPLPPLPAPLPGPGGGGGVTVILEQIMNLGQKIWKIVTDNKPALNVKNAYANAVPRGITGPEDLEGFSSLQAKSYRMHAEGVTGVVYDLTYTLLHRYNGNYRGRGRYLDAVTVLPTKIVAGWAQKVNFNVDKVAVANVGTLEAPVADIIMDMGLRVENGFHATEMRQVFEFRGDSQSVRVVE